MTHEIKPLEKSVLDAARNLAFEKAAQLRDGLCVLLALWIGAIPAHAQIAITLSEFTKAQKADWAKFQEHWHGNGKGTCMPMMSEEIKLANCTRFDFKADLHVGKHGGITRVHVTESQIVCADKAVQGELLQCFSQALRESMWVKSGEEVPLKRFSNRVIRRAAL